MRVRRRAVALILMVAAVGIASQLRSQTTTPTSTQLLALIDPINRSAEALEKLTSAFTELARSGTAGWDEIQLRRARSDLIELSQGLVTLHSTQVVQTIPALIGYRMEPTGTNWANAMKSAYRTLVLARGMLKTLRNQHSEVVLQPSYSALDLTLSTRESLLSKLLNTTPPKTKEELAALRKVTDAYITLSEALADATTALNAYSAKLGEPPAKGSAGSN